MSLVISSLVLCISLLGASPQGAPAPAPNPDPRENVDTAIVAAIHLLESKDYKTFLLQFVPPDQVKLRGGTPEAMDAWVELFSSRADRVLAALKYARTQTPTYDEAKTTATYPLNGEGGQDSLNMIKIGRFWYIRNK